MSDGFTVLLVEDNPADARLVEELFVDARADLRELLAGDGAGPDDVAIRHETSIDGAVAALEDPDVGVDVVLLDLHLPDSEGLATVEAVLSVTRRIPVVVLTGMRDAALGVEAVQAGAQDFLVKDDVTGEILVHSISYAVQRMATESELRRRTEQLAIMNQLTRHDIRNDVSLVVGRASELRDAVDERHRDAVEEIITASNHVLQLTRTIGDAVEAITDPDESALDAVDLADVLERELEKARRLHPNADVTVSDELPAVDVVADRLLSSVFGNLLSNAMLYAGADDPAVTVDVDVGAEAVTVAVADRGPGIPPRQRRLVFERESTDLEGSGIGIGLYLVDRLVERYGGDVWIEDNEPTGSVFVVELQRA